MKKDTYLINIYLKIHNKQTLTLDDLRYLAQYAPECFEKTCKNVVYNLPEAKPIMDTSSTEQAVAAPTANAGAAPDALLPIATAPLQLQTVENQNIEQVLENLKRLEAKDLPIADIDCDRVKNLLGNLYMELLFPHNDKSSFFSVSGTETKSQLDFKV